MRLALLALGVLVLTATSKAPTPGPVSPKRDGGELDAGVGPVAPGPEKFEFEKLQLVLLKRPANPPQLPEARMEELQREHLAHLTRMGELGKMVIAGPFDQQDDPSLRGLCLYRVGSLAEAKALASEDPKVKAGVLEVVAMDWYFGKGHLAFPKAGPMAPPPVAVDGGQASP